jgi:hypothetical protein
MAILPYMKQLPQDYYKNNYIPPPEVVPVPDVPTPVSPLPPSTPLPTDPINQGGIWIGTIYPSPAGEGWLFFNTNNNTLHIYVDSAWELMPGSSGISDAPSDGKTYARLSAAWTNTYDGGAY